MFSTTSSFNLGARDVGIRCLTYTPVSKRLTAGQARFDQYWRDEHGPLCAGIPGVNYLVQHHFSRQSSSLLWPAIDGVRRLDIAFDGAVEMGFSTPHDHALFLRNSANRRCAENHLFGWNSAYQLPDGSRTFLDRQHDDSPFGPDQLYRLHLYLKGRSKRPFQIWISVLTAQFAQLPEIKKLRLHLPEPHEDNGRPAAWAGAAHKGADDLSHPAILEMAFQSPLEACHFFASVAFQASIAGQAEHVEAMAVFLVAGVYTYVRNGVLSVAARRQSIELQTA